MKNIEEREWLIIKIFRLFKLNKLEIVKLFHKTNSYKSFFYIFLYMKVVALATGSSGNSYIFNIKSNPIENQHIMLDCGFSYKYLKESCFDEGIDITQINHLIISHEHTDHIKGLQMIIKNNPTIHLIISRGTYKALKLNHNNITFIGHAQIIKIGDCEIMGVEKEHDGLEPLSFILKDINENKSVAQFTDLGDFTPLHSNLLKHCDIIFLECNYDDDQLRFSNMHFSYIQRLQSSQGHLSNNQAKELCSNFLRDNQTIVLSHISENVNTYEKAYQTIKGVIFKKNTQNNSVIISFQKESTGWIE